MAVKKRGELLAEKRPFRPICGRCADGWLYEVWEVVTWKQDGKKSARRKVDYQWPIPMDWKAKDRWVNYYFAIKRCGCVAGEIIEQQESPEPLVEMPTEIAQTTIGSLVKRMR